MQIQLDDVQFLVDCRRFGRGSIRIRSTVSIPSDFRWIFLSETRNEFVRWIGCATIPATLTNRNSRGRLTVTNVRLTNKEVDIVDSLVRFTRQIKTETKVGRCRDLPQLWTMIQKKN